MAAMIPAAAAQSQLSAGTDVSGELYLARLAGIIDDIHRLAPDSAEGDGPLLTILPDADVPAMPGFESLSEIDRNLARAGRRLFDLYTELGGSAGKQPLFIQRTSSGLFTAREGSAGEVSSTPGKALGAALQGMGLANGAMPGAVAAIVPDLVQALASRPGAGPTFDLLKALAPKPVARLARNQRTGITISGPDVSRAGLDAVLAGPPGSQFGKIRIVNETLETTLVLDASSADGFARLFLYSAADALTPVASYDISVSGGGAAAPAAEPDDHGASAATATPLLGAGTTAASALGHIGDANDIDVFSLLVSAPGILRIASQGAADVDARLVDGQGQLMAEDADSGARYNFALGVTLAPGVYYLSLTHCCGGAGGYRVDAAIDPL